MLNYGQILQRTRKNQLKWNVATNSINDDPVNIGMNSFKDVELWPDITEDDFSKNFQDQDNEEELESNINNNSLDATLFIIVSCYIWYFCECNAEFNCFPSLCFSATKPTCPLSCCIHYNYLLVVWFRSMIGYHILKNNLLNKI